MGKYSKSRSLDEEIYTANETRVQENFEGVISQDLTSYSQTSYNLERTKWLAHRIRRCTAIWPELKQSTLFSEERGEIEKTKTSNGQMLELERS